MQSDDRPERCTTQTAAWYGSPVRRRVTQRVSAETMVHWTRREAEVVLLLRLASGRYLVHTKDFYPEGVYRLLSGGVHSGEDLVAAAHREAWEETGLRVQVERYLARVEHLFVADGARRLFVSHLFLLRAEHDAPPAAQDTGEAISGYRELSLRQVAALADALESLSGAWAEWGRFRAVAHRLAGEVLADDIL